MTGDRDHRRRVRRCGSGRRSPMPPGLRRRRGDRTTCRRGVHGGLLWVQPRVRLHDAASTRSCTSTGERLPRTRVPAGSVAIAAGYTSVYPSASPGGWHLLGHTDGEHVGRRSAPNRRLLAPGTIVRFRRVAGRERGVPAHRRDGLVDDRSRTAGAWATPTSACRPPAPWTAAPRRSPTGWWATTSVSATDGDRRRAGRRGGRAAGRRRPAATA